MMICPESEVDFISERQGMKLLMEVLFWIKKCVCITLTVEGKMSFTYQLGFNLILHFD